MNLAVRSARVVLPTGERPAALHIRDGRIAAVRPHDEWPVGVRRLDAGELMILPGLVDTHVHINEPGRTDWEGFDSATRAAAAGGVTTVIDMPLNSVPATTTVRAFNEKWAAANGNCWVDVGFWGGVVPGSENDLEPLARAGVRGFKCFLSPSGVDEFQHVTESDLHRALPVLKQLELPLLVHAELPELLKVPHGNPREYETWLTSRPPEAEHAAIDLMIDLARRYGVHVHIVHLASARALLALSAARAAGVPITVETCPHYLTFAGEDIPEGLTTVKCAPPIRGRDDREGLWRGLETGGIDLIATDHSPAPPAMKEIETGDFVRAWGGIASLQLGLAAAWTGAQARGLSASRLAHWMAAAPARLARLADTKGVLAPGHDADLVIWDPDRSAPVDLSSIYHRHPITPYAGMTLRGRVKATVLRGEIVFDADAGFTTPAGRLLAKVV